MPPQARLGDRSLIPADVHGCPACPHVASGPAVAGSANVLVNGRPAIRVNDPGIHAACCGSNIWNAKTGSRSVLINGRSAHREQDSTIHCGGIGKTIEGSPNVLVGDRSKSYLSDKSKKKSWIRVRLVDGNGEPTIGEKYELHLTDGQILTGKLDGSGVIFIDQLDPGICKIVFPEIYDEEL